MIRACLLTLAACSLAAGAATAQQPQWQAYQYPDENGRPMAGVVFGIPETDATLFTGTCSTDAPRDIVVHLNVDPGPNQANAQVQLQVDIGGRTEARSAVIRPGPEGPYTEVVLVRSDPLWESLMAERSGSIAVPGGSWSAFHLNGSRAAISQFLASCDSIAAAGPAGASSGVALIGPLYIVGAETPMVAGLQDPHTVAMLPPGTEVMSTNAYGALNNRDWAEVVTDRGAGTAGWVELADLLPSDGGAAEFENLNQVANLLLRAQPSSGGAVVGSVPPAERGIFADGAMQNEWILVRYGNTVGWASHTYLLPILPGGAEGPGAVPGYHEATYGSWRLECDPCRHPEDGAVCQIGALTGPLTVHFFEGDDRPINLTYGPPMELHEPEASTLTLRMVVDGGEIAALRTPDWQVWEMTGEIGIPTFGDMVVAMRTGHNLTIALEGPATQVADSFSLAGFAEAQNDLLTIFPVENLHFSNEAMCPNL